MEHIQVKISTVDYDTVCQYYNQHKLSNFNPIKRLNRLEGGFCIDLDTKSQSLDENDNIKQVRWYRRNLITQPMYYSFNNDETKLLFESLKAVYGDDNIFLTSEPIYK